MEDNNDILQTGKIIDDFTFLTPYGRIIYAFPFKQYLKDKNDPTSGIYKATILFDKDTINLDLFKEWMNKYGASQFKTYPKGVKKIRLLDTDELDDNRISLGERFDWAKGCYQLEAKNKNYQPIVVDKDKQRITEDSGFFYNGCYGRFVIKIYKNEKPTTSLNINLKVIQKLEDGELLGNTNKPKGILDMF
jgi:hypothetical protein